MNVNASNNREAKVIKLYRHQMKPFWNAKCLFQSIHNVLSFSCIRNCVKRKRVKSRLKHYQNDGNNNKKRIVILFSIFHWFSVLKCSWCENINYLLLIWKRFMFCGLSLMDFCALFRSNNRNYCFKYTDFYICILRECSSVVYILKWTNSNTAKNIECEISKWYCNISE